MSGMRWLGRFGEVFDEAWWELGMVLLLFLIFDTMRHSVMITDKFFLLSNFVWEFMSILLSVYADCTLLSANIIVAIYYSLCIL